MSDPGLAWWIGFGATAMPLALLLPRWARQHMENRRRVRRLQQRFGGAKASAKAPR